MKKKTGILSKIYIAILLIFLYSPIAVLIFYSFNNGKTTVWKGFTFKWYVQLFRDDNIMNALWNTVIIAVLVGKGGKANHNNRNHCENNHPDYVGNRGLA